MSHINTTYKKWSDWSLRIQGDIKRTVYHQDIWLIFSDKVRKNIDHLTERNAQIFLSFMKLTYTDSAVIGVRRQVKGSSDEISLVRLLNDMKQQSTLLTLKNYCAFHGDKISDSAGFNFYSNGQNQISNKLLDCDLEKLKNALEKIEGFADSLVAHPSKKTPA
jgi:hypothetical protein